MSRSYHVTIKKIKQKTRQEIDDMFHDPDSLLQEWAKKKEVKKCVKKERRDKQQQKMTKKLIFDDTPSD